MIDLKDSKTIGFKVPGSRFPIVARQGRVGDLDRVLALESAEEDAGGEMTQRSRRLARQSEILLSSGKNWFQKWRVRRFIRDLTFDQLLVVHANLVALANGWDLKELQERSTKKSPGSKKGIGELLKEFRKASDDLAVQLKKSPEEVREMTGEDFHRMTRALSEAKQAETSFFSALTGKGAR